MSLLVGCFGWPIDLETKRAPFYCRFHWPSGSLLIWPLVNELANVITHPGIKGSMTRLIYTFVRALVLRSPEGTKTLSAQKSRRRSIPKRDHHVADQLPADYRKHVDGFLAAFDQPGYLFVLGRDLSGELASSILWVLDAPAGYALADALEKNAADLRTKLGAGMSVFTKRNGFH